MTEAEWMTCTDPESMLHFMRGKVSDRKLRLFACACCRADLALVRGDARDSLETAERFADGQATQFELTTANAAAQREVHKRSCGVHGSGLLAARATQAVVGAAGESAFEAARLASAYGACPTWAADYRAEQFQKFRFHCALLRDVLGNPLACTSLRTSWLAWNDGAARKLAEAIYDARAFDRLPLLADALEDAGCDNADTLAHCRCGGEHVRGCWVVDLLLGKS